MVRPQYADDSESKRNVPAVLKLPSVIFTDLVSISLYPLIKYYCSLLFLMKTVTEWEV